MAEDAVVMAEQGVTEVVALSRHFDLVKNFADAGDGRLKLVRPEEVSDPASIEAALCWLPKDDAFDAYPNLKIAASIAAGVDGILACPSLRGDIVVTRVRDDAQAAMMAGFAAWNVVWHHRRMGAYVENQKQGLWDRSFRPEQPGQVTVGVLGFGLMGRAVAQAVAAMGYTVLAAARSPRAPEPGIEILSGEGSVEAVVARAAILINVLPLTEGTRDILCKPLFDRMPMGATLIQIGRGEHMVEDDFLAALNEGRIGAATLDVFRQEPLPDTHPFWADPRILVTPHKASDTTREEALRQLADNLDALRAGETPPGAVDRAAGY